MMTAQPFVRPAREDDLDALFELAALGGDGLTNLPANRAVLAAKLRASVGAVASADARETGAAIILMTEAAGEVVGTSCIFVRVGAEWPFYSYRLTRQAAVSRALGRTKAQMLLNLANDFDGETEIGGLFVAPAARGLGVGGLTARARYLFIAANRDWFRTRVIAELRGYQDDDGRSPVWEAIGRHFYDMDFAEADRTNAVTGNQFIADLGPRHPIYRSLLAPDAQAALGRPHDDGRPAYDMLIAEGFRADGYVDIFDGGPTLVADIDGLRTVSRMTRTVLAAVEAVDAAPVLAGSGAGIDFRATFAPVAAGSNGAVATPDLAAVLGLAPGDPFYYAAA